MIIEHNNFKPLSSTEVENLQKGNHIRVNYDKYYHHGIYIGNGEIVHFFGDDEFDIYSKNLTIKKTTFELFSNNKITELKIYTENETSLLLPKEEILKNAIDSIGQNNYDILFNNCEHFANFCTFGKRISYYQQLITEKSKNIKRNDGLLGFIEKFNDLLKQ